MNPLAVEILFPGSVAITGSPHKLIS